MNNDKNFQWTDDLVADFAAGLAISVRLEGKKLHPFAAMEQFKKDKSPTPILQPFFDEQKKDWEILSMQYEGGNEIFIKKGDGLFYCDKCPNEGFSLEDDLLNNKIGKKYLIHSVRRTSDGEVFTVGEKTEQGYIKQLKIGVCSYGVTDKTKMYVSLTKDAGLANLCAGYDLNNVQKVKERPFLFTTEDGMAVKLGDVLWIVNKHSNYSIERIASASEYDGHNKNYEYFGDKQEAENWRAMNQPCLSVNDVLEIQIGMPTEHAFLETKKLKELAKQKIAK